MSLVHKLKPEMPKGQKYAQNVLMGKSLMTVSENNDYAFDGVISHPKLAGNRT
jgi:hypothetical protein